MNIFSNSMIFFVSSKLFSKSMRFSIIHDFFVLFFHIYEPRNNSLAGKKFEKQVMIVDRASERTKLMRERGSKAGASRPMKGERVGSGCS